MNRLARLYPFIATHWMTTTVISSTVGLAAFICIRCLESEDAKAQRIRRKNEHEIKVLTEKISTYARNVHKHFPTGDVVVGENDLAEQLRKHPDAVATALNVLLGQQKVQKAPLRGYWKLNISSAPSSAVKRKAPDR
jgi:uncharacterized membrane-anchored protein YhcB (DUF1043 family)